MSTVTVAVKTCTKCGETKPLDQFYPYSPPRLGYRPDCRQCHLEAKRQYKARAVVLAEAEFVRAPWVACPTCGTVGHGPCDRFACQQQRRNPE